MFHSGDAFAAVPVARIRHHSTISARDLTIDLSVYINRSMRFRVDPHSGVPLGVQIARQLRLRIATGRLAPGDRLPSARKLAAELGVNFHTVRKAYGELESAGLLALEPGRGTFVREGATDDPALTDELRREVRRHLLRLVESLATTPVRPEVLARLLREESERVFRADAIGTWNEDGGDR